MNELLLGRPTAEAKCEKLFLAMLPGRLSLNESKTLLLLLAKKGEEPSEISGCLRAIRRLEPPRRVSLPFLIDVCGTGGDGKHTFNISTVSSFVIAAAGGYVAKHGNRSVSSRVGSSDLMEALGVRLDIPFRQMLNALHHCHLGYFHAPRYHPSFARVQGLRRELAIRTIFNLMGPLVNPVELHYQMIGVSNLQWLEPLAETLRRLRKRSAVFRSAEGLDELSTREMSNIFYIEGKKIRSLCLDPKRLGFSKGRPHDYEGGDIKTNREIALGILENRLRGPRRDVVLLNSGFALWLAGVTPSIKEGVEKSCWAIRTGQALEVLKALRRATHRRT